VSEPVKVLPMAKLLRLAREKEERERAEREAEAAKTLTENSELSIDVATKIQSNQARKAILPQTIVEDTIPQLTIPVQTIVTETEIAETSTNDTVTLGNKQKIRDAKNQRAGKKKPSSQDAIPRQTIVQQNIVDNSKGYYPIFNDISDRLIPELGLDPYQQAVLQRLYRLSRGWKSEECEVGLGTLAKYCVMSRSQVQRSVAKLIEKGLIECLGSSKKGGKEGNRYRVLPGLDAIPRQTIPKETIVPETIVESTIVSEDETGSCENTVVSQGIVPESTNKNSNKDLKNNTHTEEGVGVGSKFSLEECRRYARHLQKTGQGINNPGGYATAIFRSGEADAQIEAFLNPPASSSNLKVDGCPDCGGSGYYYPEGMEKGVKLCKHEKLKGSGQK
jgi:hypothetical protein